MYTHYQTINMSNIPYYEIFHYRNFYQYEGELYAKQFPKEWAQTHAKGTGPNACANCRDVGSWNGVFIGYCTNCAEMEYQLCRGHGFIKPGKEAIKDNANTSAFQTYLKDVVMDSIGDKDMFDSYAVHYAEDDDGFAEELSRLESTIIQYYKNKAQNVTIIPYKDDDILSEASEYDSANESDDELNQAVILDNPPCESYFV